MFGYIGENSTPGRGHTSRAGANKLGYLFGGKGIWLPIVDAFRTFATCPPPPMRAVFQSLVLVMAPWGQAWHCGR
jgi:hypothetical protein